MMPDTERVAQGDYFLPSFPRPWCRFIRAHHLRPAIVLAFVVFGSDYSSRHHLLGLRQPCRRVYQGSVRSVLPELRLACLRTPWQEAIVRQCWCRCSFACSPCSSAHRQFPEVAQAGKAGHRTRHVLPRLRRHGAVDRPSPGACACGARAGVCGRQPHHAVPLMPRQARGR